MADQWQISSFVCILLMLVTQVHSQSSSQILEFINVTGAEQKGAVCIDGSPAGYRYAPGFGNGVNNWIVNLMGGGWCGSLCRDRYNGTAAWAGLGGTKGQHGSTFGGVLNSNEEVNPDFYNWHKVDVHYCDGSCFTGDTEFIDDKGIKMQLRGSRIFDAVMDELLAKGLKNATNAILMGGSAGGLSTILHCDGFRALIPNASRVKCISDSGIFIRAKDLPYTNKREGEFADVVEVHNLTSFLPTSCTSRMDPRLCLFPENLIGDIQTPLFLLNSAFDSFELQYRMQPNSNAERLSWADCTKTVGTFSACTPTQIQLIKDYGKEFHETLKRIPNNPSRGLFINSCFNHIFAFSTKAWSSNEAPKVENRTMSEAIGDWYFDRSSVQLIDTQNDFPFKCQAMI